MSRSVYSLIEQALYLSGRSDPEFSPVDPSGSDVNQVAYLLQDILSSHRYDVPFYEKLTRATAAELTDLNIASVNYVKYFLGTSSYPLKSMTQEDFATYQSIENINAPPGAYYFNRKENKIEVYPVPIPNSTDKFEVGYLPLNGITSLQQPIPSEWPPFAQKFFKYQLAKLITHLYKLPWLYEQELEVSNQDMVYNRESRIPEAKTPNWKSNSGDVPAISVMYYLTGGR